MRKIKFVSCFALLVLLLSTGMVKLPTMAQELASRPYPSTDWITFVHPEFGFLFSYPADWQLENYPSLTAPSGTVLLTNTKPETLGSATNDGSIMEAINVGLHLVEWGEPAELADWVRAYDEIEGKSIYLVGVVPETYQ